MPQVYKELCTLKGDERGRMKRREREREVKNTRWITQLILKLSVECAVYRLRRFLFFHNLLCKFYFNFMLEPLRRLQWMQAKVWSLLSLSSYKHTNITNNNLHIFFYCLANTRLLNRHKLNTRRFQPLFSESSNRLVFLSSVQTTW